MAENHDKPRAEMLDGEFDAADLRIAGDIARDAHDKKFTKSTIEDQFRRMHFDDVRHSLRHAYYQGWDLHPAQLPTRYAAVYSFFLEAMSFGTEDVQEAVNAFLEKRPGVWKGR